MLRTLVVSCGLALALPAVAAAQTAPPPAEFVAKAGASDKFEVMAGKLAETHAASAAVKRFGRRMIVDHTKSTRLVEAAVKKSQMPPPPPPVLSDEQTSMLADLRAKYGKAFDEAYIPEQMKAHQQALDLMTAEAAGGDNPDLKAAATKIAPVVKMHIAMLQKLGG